MLEKFKSLENKSLDKLPLQIMLIVMGVLVVLFNVMGYEILFYDDPWFGIASPFGILLGVTEFAVLLWTSAVIKDWCNSSWILKSLIWLLVPAFAMLCYFGINSYLNTLATADIRQVLEVKTRNANNDEYLVSARNEKNTIETQLSNLSNKNEAISNKISDINRQINTNNSAASERRLKATDCSLVADCASSVLAFQDQAKRLNNELPNLIKSQNKNSERIHKLENQLDDILIEIKELKRSSTIAINQHAGTESTFMMKKKAYEDIVLSITGWFNWIPSDPFNIFIGFISALIYPVYFILNLFLALNSESNIAARNIRKSLRQERKSLRQTVLNKILKYQRTRVLRAKKSVLARKSRRNTLYSKYIKYFRVWAHRRKKVIEKEIEKIIEVETFVDRDVDKIIEIEVEKEVEIIVEVEVIKEIEIEKIVEKIKEVEVRVEVPVEVDRIVKVPTEVPVYVDKIKKVPEPIFIKDPQIIIHERVIPVPENITGAQLEELLNAQPRLNEDARTAERNVVIPSKDKGHSKTAESRPESDRAAAADERDRTAEPA
ncbi:hypothetical protein [Moritella sp. F3]|uniref:hypothetical protein n=1 Tax=Moritella sp. F3 TaxID=2718882 RepID=UPI0018E11326|nr:hypothetical protein [Moritella sp. F3]GIC76851.1 hypothetical protein FMO001_15780 [Moritella sp. F1]GIC81037.1 hypothetical protein FMO003_13180 [Moritella sp. F3]